MQRCVHGLSKRRMTVIKNIYTFVGNVYHNFKIRRTRILPVTFLNLLVSSFSIVVAPLTSHPLYITVV